MDSLSLFRRGPALYCRNGVVTSSLYADGAVRCRSYVLHIMALSPLGIKPLWSPFLDLIKTKRWWIIIMQTLVGAAFAGVAFTVNTLFMASRNHSVSSGYLLSVVLRMM